MVAKLDKENFEREVTNEKLPVVIDFWAGWCMPCQAMAPRFEELEKEYGNKIKFAKANVEEEKEMADFFKVRSIPTFAIVHEKEVVGKILGALEKEEFREKLNKILDKLNLRKD